MKQIAVLIPCYNESQTIAKVVDDFKKALNSRGGSDGIYFAQNGEQFEYQIYVYDNNSSDGTAQIARDAGATVRSENRQGKGNVIRSMFREVNADVYIMADGDDTNCPFGDGHTTANVHDLIDEVLTNNVDMVIGKRREYFLKTGETKKLNGMGNKLVTKLVQTFFKTDIDDILTGFRAFSKKFVKTFPVVSAGFEIETELTIHTAFHNLKHKEILTTYRERPAGSESKLNAVSDGIKVLWMIGRLIREYRPLGFFVSFAGILALVGVLFGISPVADYFKTGLVAHFPSLIVSVLFILAGFIIAQAGLIMHLIVKKNKQVFEYAYYGVR